MKFYVYVLCREDGTPFYVGRGTKARWGQHERAVRRGEVKGNRQKYEIIKAILAAGREVEKRKLGTFATIAEASAFEVATIKAIGRTVNGGPLVNRTDGGEGGRGGLVLSEATRTKIGDANRGRKKPDGFGAKMSKLHTGRVWDRDVVERRAAKIRGKTRSDECKKNLSAIKKGVPLSEAHVAALRGIKRSAKARENISRGLMGRSLSESHKEKLRGKRQSEATKRRMAEAQVGKVKSPEVRANMRAAWVKRRAANAPK